MELFAMSSNMSGRSFYLKLFLAVAMQLFIAQYAIAQLYYEKNDSISVQEQGDAILYPFQGGFNAPQFNEIDLDYDNQMDLVIFDRSGSRITTYLNKGTAGQINYQYAPQYEDLFPEISDWLITRDYNCDGKMDLITGVRGASVWVYEDTGNVATGPQFVYVGKVRSTYYGSNFELNINPGGANFPGVVDMNNDGDIDFIYFNASGNQIEFHRNLSVETTGECGLLFEQRSDCWGVFVEAGFNSTIYLDSCRTNAIPNPESDGGSIRELEKERINEQKRNSKHAGSSVSCFDLDNSGSMDLILGDVGSKNLTALYNDDSVSPFIKSHINILDSAFPSYSTPIDLDIFPAAFFLDVNNDQKKDMLVSTNSNGYLARSKYKDNMLFYENTGTTSSFFQFRSNNFLQEEVIDLGRGAYPAFFDYNNDGLQDILLGNDGYYDSSTNSMIGQLALLVNTGTPLDPSYDLIDRDFANLSKINLDLSTNSPQRFLIPALGDLDGDGDDDLLIGDDDGRIHYFIDTSSASDPAGFKLEKAAFQQLNVFRSAAPSIIDVDLDSLPDLVIGNNIGILEYHKNMGTSTEPIFNLEVQSITWQYDTILRYQLRGNPDLRSLEIGQVLSVQNALNPDNSVPQTILTIDNSQKYLDLIHPFTNSAIDDETNSTAVIDYSVKFWGDVRLSEYHNTDQNAVPFMYRDSSNSLKLVIGSWRGYLYFFENIDTNITSGKFNMVDSIYAKKKFGSQIGVGGADLNSDGMIDIAIGNEAGGFEILYATGYYPRDSSGNPVDTTGNDTAISVQELSVNEMEIKLYPNPNKNEFFIEVGTDISIYDLRVFDLNGRTVVNRQNVSQKRLRIDHDLQAGIYLVEIKSSERRLTAKLMVNPY